MSPSDTVAAALAELPVGCVILRSNHTLNLRWANSALTTNGDTETTAVTVVAIHPADAGARVAVSSGHVAEPDEAAELARTARAAAVNAAPTDAAELIGGSVDDAYDEVPAGIGAGTTDRVIGAVSTFLAAPHGQFGYAEVDSATTYLATTSGARFRRVQETVRIEASARDGHGSTWWGTNDLSADFAAAAATATERLAIQRRREQLTPGRHAVILSPSAVADLMVYLAWSANGRDAVEGHNVFARPGGGTRLGDTLSERQLDLYADPAFPGLSTADRVVVEADSSMESVFDNALPLGRTDLLTGGRLTALRASRPTATRFGLQPAYLADNLILTDAHGQGTTDDLVARTDEALFINCLWYIREVDPQNLLLTGLTRDGVYRIRGGRIVAACPNFRFNVSVPDLLARVVDASRTSPCLPREWADWFTRAAMPALHVDGFHLSSPSEAL
jgi:predicted Zn-dependent protease